MRKKVLPVVNAESIRAAYDRIKGGIYYSPCPESIPLGEIADCRIYCKLDYLQRTGSFKERGARNALLLLDENTRKRGVIAASAGNHALGLSYHGKLLEVPVTVVMPGFAPLIKVTTCQSFGASVILHGETFDEAREFAQHMAREQKLHYVHAFDDPIVIAGQGTLGLEVLEQVPELDAIVVPVGGAGLLAGIATYIKAHKPRVKVYGVEPERAANFGKSFEHGRPVDAPIRPTLADGLAVQRVGEMPLKLLQGKLDGIVTVTEDELALAILRIVEREKGVVEGAGAAALAAFLSGKLAHLSGKKVVLPLCGGNIDPLVLSRVVDRALVADGRLHRFTVAVPDRPGWLGKLGDLMGRARANIVEIVHERAFAGGDVMQVLVRVTIETRDRQHIDEVRGMLAMQGFDVHA